MSCLQKDVHGERAAVRWFFRLRGADSPALEPEELKQWERFAAEPANRQQLAEVKAVWQAVQTLRGPKMPTEAELEADDFDDSISVSQWMAHSATRKRAKTTPLGRSTNKLLLAASLAAAVIGITYYGTNSNPREQAQAFATPIAEQRVVSLADGSIVTLGARTEIQTRVTAAERVIVLDRGEAWFKVAHDRQRPFRVFAGSGVITAVGTEFNVRRDREADVDRVTVTVGAGAVKVEPRSITEGNSISLRRIIARNDDWEAAKLVKGQELTYEGEGERGEVKRADIEAAAAWKEGRLEYIHQPLKVVVARVNRYSEKPIVLADDSVGALDYSGTVFEGQIDEWLRALRNAFPISVTEDDDRILIRRRALPDH